LGGYCDLTDRRCTCASECRGRGPVAGSAAGQALQGMTLSQGILSDLDKSARQPQLHVFFQGRLDGMGRLGSFQAIASHRRAAALATASLRRGAIRPVTTRAASFSQWYADVIAAADLVDNSPVRGCAILKPRGYAIWDAIRRELDHDIAATGHSNAYFPLLLPLSFLGREAQHVAGFAKECAVVTHHRVRGAVGPDGSPGLEPDPGAQLRDPLVIRPTSETIIWDAFRRWISTHNDLPILINQWANVVRWEMRTRPFLRTTEFLWQEGHTAHAAEGEARREAATMLEVYRSFIEEFLAVPVIEGAKSTAERFAGAVDTLTCETMMQNGARLLVRSALSEPVSPNVPVTSYCAVLCVPACLWCVQGGRCRRQRPTSLGLISLRRLMSSLQTRREYGASCCGGIFQADCSRVLLCYPTHIPPPPSSPPRPRA